MARECGDSNNHECFKAGGWRRTDDAKASTRLPPDRFFCNPASNGGLARSAGRIGANFKPGSGMKKYLTPRMIVLGGLALIYLAVLTFFGSPLLTLTTWLGLMEG